MKGLIAPPTLLALRSLSFAYFVQAVGALSVVGCLQQISQEWLLTDTQSAYLISLFGITFALAAPLLQVVLGHLPRRRQVLLGLGLFSSASLLFALAPNYGVLVLARVLMGLGAGFIGPVLGALGSALVDRAQQGRAIAIVLLGLSVAGMAGIPLAAWIAQHWGVRSLYLMLSVAGFMTALLIARFVPDHVQGERIAVSTVVSLLTRLGPLSTFLVVFFITSGVFSTYAFLSPIIRDVYHGGPEDVSVALAVLGIAGVAGNLFVTRAAGRYSAEHMLLSGISLLAVTLLLLGYGPARLGWLLPVLVLWAFATDMVWPSQQRRVVERMPERRGIALALTASFMFCGIGFGSAVAGWVYPAYGYMGVLSASLLFFVMATVCLMVSYSRIKAAIPVA